MRLSYSPGECREALAAAPLTVVDIETTGLGRRDQLVAVGALAGAAAFIQIVRPWATDISCDKVSQPIEAVREALSPLADSKGVVVFHNASFDVPFLARNGIEIGREIHDTLQLLRLADPDRGGDKTEKRKPRIDRRTGEPLNYRLKNVAGQLLNLDAVDFPGSVHRQPLRDLSTYLLSDLLVTARLYEELKDGADGYYRQFVTPITSILCRMAGQGIAANSEFIARESARSMELMAAISADHRFKFGIGLDVGDRRLRQHFFGDLKLRPVHWSKKNGASLARPDLMTLSERTTDDRAKESLRLAIAYSKARSLLRLRSLEKHISDGRFWPSFSDPQASGRVSVKSPNLQALAKLVDIDGHTFASRNVVVAAEGHSLAAFDVAQADVRVLAHEAASLRDTGSEYLARLQEERLERLPSAVRELGEWSRRHHRGLRRECTAPGCNRLVFSHGYCQEHFDGQVATGDLPPHFSPELPAGLADDFRRGTEDFYSTATESMLGRPPADKAERNAMKQTVLGMVNGLSVPGLAERLKFSLEAARDCFRKFNLAYPREAAYIALQPEAIAITGSATTWAGRVRRSTPHWWMTEGEPVQVLLSYRNRDKLWVRVIPLRPSRHVLTCFVESVVDAGYRSKNRGLEIYHHRDGRISSLPYRFFEDDKLAYSLPIRNIAWRIIRRIRTATEEARYEGFDRTRRAIANHVYQGGTADIVRAMMIRVQPVCRQFGARLILQIHDELVFEVPDERLAEFVATAKAALEGPPVPNFQVPIVVEPKVGKRFGELLPV